jgi:hypothetical protein
VVTKDIKHWLLISLWWSPHPDEDFGEDRPDSLRGMGVWSNYKMCVVSDYAETAENPAVESRKLGFNSLANSMEVVQLNAGGDSWCANPYIELGQGNTRTNCIGCHQHSGTAVSPVEVFLDDPKDSKNAARRAAFPGNGRRQVRKNFPHDYLWSIGTSPDTFEATIAAKAQEIDLLDE